MAAHLEEIERLEVSSSLMTAYLINMGKAIIFVAGLIGAFYLVLYITDTNPFIGMFETIGIPIVWATRVAIACIGIFLALAFFDTLALTSYRLVFEEDALSYSYGGFFKTTKSTPIANIVRVNFKEYKPLKLGDIIVEFTGTEEQILKVKYVSHAKEQCELVNKLISLKKSQKTEEIIEKGGVE
jgi:hypothetical protein